MKFYTMRLLVAFISFLLLPLPPLSAQGGDDFMRSTGKINVVVAVIALLFLGIVAYLIRLDGKLSRLEKDVSESEGTLRD